MPTGSLDPDASAVTGSGTEPALGPPDSAAPGGATTVTVALAVADAPALSVTVAVTVYEPVDEKTWPTIGVPAGPAVVPSPKLNRKLVIGLLPAVEPDASAATERGAPPDVGFTDSDAVGGAACVTVTGLVEE